MAIPNDNARPPNRNARLPNYNAPIGDRRAMADGRRPQSLPPAASPVWRPSFTERSDTYNMKTLTFEGPFRTNGKNIRPLLRPGNVWKQLEFMMFWLSSKMPPGRKISKMIVMQKP